eukprot:CAMPEP_0206276588 /NCGR_PEP_ID=MMETSP0047_2-20121206/36385_1 /ASSEMBLY_ACC=CAM_ASM_000192 /TAXON_ID=195065 /ORGANISM="Chroomonas mesostigmatica_cf, Strain CCMP1168" /LENGTH=97 /DNA_ID=CAMNT_0053706113 /DNA_START=89 /DNA_END=379 /DNA_ORIENTATION=-
MTSSSASALTGSSLFLFALSENAPPESLAAPPPEKNLDLTSTAIASSSFLLFLFGASCLSDELPEPLLLSADFSRSCLTAADFMKWRRIESPMAVAA